MKLQEAPSLSILFLIAQSSQKKQKPVKATHYFVTVTNKNLFSFSLNKRQRTAKGPTRRSIPICTSTRDPWLSLPAVHRRAAGGLRLQPSREKGDAGSPGAPHCYVRQPRAGFSLFLFGSISYSAARTNTQQSKELKRRQRTKRSVKQPHLNPTSTGTQQFQKSRLLFYMNSIQDDL